jgi:hypothetical protein
MESWVILPYDDNPVARTVVHRTADWALRHGAGLLLVVAGADPAMLGPVWEQARTLVDPAVPVVVQLLSPGDPAAGLRRIVDERPVLAMAAPIGAYTAAHSYRQVVNAILHGRWDLTLILHFAPRRARAEPSPARSWAQRWWLRLTPGHSHT